MTDTKQNKTDKAHGFVQSAFQRALRPALKPNAPKFLRRAILMALSIFAPGGEGIGMASPRSIRKIFSTAAKAKELKPLIRDIGNLDTVLDTLPPDAVMRLGDAAYGTEPSPFLSSHAVTMTAYNGSIDGVVESGLMSREVANSFSNIHSVLVREQNRIKLDYLQEPSPENRQRLTNSDHNLAISIMLHMTEHFRGKIGFSGIAKERPVTLSDLNDFYPHAATIAVLFEMVDHLQDFLADMREELVKDIPSPNWIATKLHEREQLIGYNGDMLPEIRSFLMHDHQGDFVEPALVPDCVTDAIKEGEEEYYALASTLPFGYRETMISLWDLRKEGGMIIEPGFYPDRIAKEKPPKLTLVK